MQKFDREKIAMLLLKKSESARFDAMLDLIDALFVADFVRYRERDDDPEFGCEEDVYWEYCGGSIFGGE